MWQISEYVGRQHRGMSREDFELRFLEICNAHRAQGRALAFAFLICNHGQPHLRKALEDQAYWEALDQLAGRTLTVFAFDVRPTNRIDNQSSDVMYRLTPIQISRADAVGDALQGYFPDIGQKNLPCVLFFQVEDGVVIDSLAVGLRAHSRGMEAAFNELSAVLERATNALAKVQDENAQNAREIFGLIRGAMDERILRDHGLRVFHAVTGLSSVTSLLKALHGLL